MTSSTWLEIIVTWFPLFLFAALVYYIFRSDYVIKKRMSRLDQSANDQRDILDTLKEIRDLLKKERS